MNARSLAVLLWVCMMLLGCESERKNDRALESQRHGESDQHTQTATTPKAETSRGTRGKTYVIQLEAGSSRSLVYETSKREEIVLLELYSDKIVFTALISRRKFEEVMALKPPTYFRYGGLDYVRNDGMLFWGAVGKEESVLVDAESLDGFVLVNKSQIAAEGDVANAALDAMRSGDQLKLEKHYWGEDQQKKYPSFDLTSIRDDLQKLEASSASRFEVCEDDVRCRQEGERKFIWVETSVGSFALNGHAMDLVRNSRSAGNPWLDSAGRPTRIGRDVLGVDVTTSLIEAGLPKCEGD